MAIGSGLAGSIGIGAESTYGTFAPPTRWLPWLEENLDIDRKFSDGKAVVAGSLLKQSNQTVLLTQMAKGTIKVPVTTSGLGLLLKAALGAAAGPTQMATTAAYQTVATLASTAGNSLTAQIGRPQTDGTITPYSYTGCKVTGFDLTVESGNVPELSVEVVGQQLTETQALVVPVFETSNPAVFSFQQVTLKAGVTIGSEVAMANVRKFDLSLKRKLDESRFYIGGNGLLAEPLEDDFLELTGSLTADFTNTTDWDAWVLASDNVSLIINIVGGLIATGYNYSLDIAVPVALIQGADPKMSGPKIVEREVKFEALDDNVHAPLTITYTSTDITL